MPSNKIFYTNDHTAIIPELLMRGASTEEPRNDALATSQNGRPLITGMEGGTKRNVKIYGKEEAIGWIVQ